MYGYVYLTTNLITGHCYIGQKKGSFNKNYFGSGLYITRAIKKYGRENFFVRILCEAESKEELDELEIDFIKRTNANHDKDRWYNIAAGGSVLAMEKENNPFYGKDHTLEAKMKISKANKGKKLSQDSIQKMKGTWKKEGHPFLGKTHSEETKKKMAESAKKRKGKTHPRSTHIFARLPDGKVIDGYGCVEVHHKLLELGYNVPANSIKIAALKNLLHRKSNIQFWRQ